MPQSAPNSAMSVKPRNAAIDSAMLTQVGVAPAIGKCLSPRIMVELTESRKK
jgi:hypothetical protein